MFLYTLLFLDAENHPQKTAQHLRTFHHNHFHKDASSAVFAKGDPADNQRNGQNNNQEFGGENKRQNKPHAKHCKNQSETVILSPFHIDTAFFIANTLYAMLKKVFLGALHIRFCKAAGEN